jgi:hypothetical protein
MQNQCCCAVVPTSRTRCWECAHPLRRLVVNTHALAMVAMEHPGTFVLAATSAPGVSHDLTEIFGIRHLVVISSLFARFRLSRISRSQFRSTSRDHRPY